MNIQIKSIALAVVFCGSLLCLPLAQAAEQRAPSDSKQARKDVQQLVKERDEARAKAKVAEQKMRDAGVRPESLGYEPARAARDQQAASGSKAKAYNGYVKTTKDMEKKIKDEVVRGVRPLVCEDIARFERLQAELEFASLSGRLSAQQK